MAWKEVASASDLGEDEMTAFREGDVEIAIYRLEDGFYATTNICTHQYAQLTEGYIEDGMIECPLHQALFDIRTGKAQGGLAKVDLSTYPVKVEDGRVLVEF
ncbi:MAG: non-heme iron oxygenase ferredoxin subunit [Pseudomonadota bacterium]|nr:non-heme iron oxygenase ferredoxin subunit [Pseudomonadota bacterium]